jgi:hypothetical protein
MPGKTLLLCEGVVIGSENVNVEMNTAGINIHAVTSLVATGRSKIATAQKHLALQDSDGARAALSQFRKTVLHLRDGYRTLLVKEDLSHATAQKVLTLAQSLDRVAIQIGFEAPLGITQACPAGNPGRESGTYSRLD